MSSVIIEVILVSSNFVSSIYDFGGEYVVYLKFVWDECGKWEVDKKLID